MISEPIEVKPGVLIVLRGELDARLDFDDGTYGVADFKTVHLDEEHAVRYTFQLHAYAWAMERAADPDDRRAPVTTLGLLCFEPTAMVELPGGGMAYSTVPTWRPVTRDDDTFGRLLGVVGNLLSRPAPPPTNVKCQWCRFRVLSAA